MSDGGYGPDLTANPALLAREWDGSQRYLQRVRNARNQDEPGIVDSDMPTEPDQRALRRLGTEAGSDMFELRPGLIRDISAEVLGPDGRMQILPAAYWAGTTTAERALFGHTHGIYSLPTVELVDHLRAVIGPHKAIEIGAGNGVLAQALGIVATDSRQQEKEPWRSAILAARQPLVPYGDNVIEMAGNRAVRHYKPDIVLACWVTHKYRPHRHSDGGNQAGVTEEDILTQATYIFVGNEKVHQHKSIWNQPHSIEYPPYVYSRSQSGAREFIATWPGRRR